MWTSGVGAKTCPVPKSNDELIQLLIDVKIIHSSPVEEAMRKTDRALYVPPIDLSKCVSSTYKYGPYADAPQSIGHKVTISAPYIHAISLEYLQYQIMLPGSRILDVGSGSGVLLAYMSRISSSDSLIVGVEIIPELVEKSIQNLRQDGFEVDEKSGILSDTTQSESGRVIVLNGDGWEGASTLGPFDAINVGAGAACLPQKLVDQLKPGGAILIPIGGKVQSTMMLTKFTKQLVTLSSNDDVSSATYHMLEERIREVRFVPLVHGLNSSSRLDPASKKYDSSANEIDWDKRYKKGFAYGNKPNPFVIEAYNLYLKHHERQLNVLSLGEGQGRNISFLASLGHKCTAIDISEVGLEKARKFVEQRGCEHFLKTIKSDLITDDLPYESYDVIFSIFCMFPPAQRRVLHSRCIQRLRPGGIIVIQCFSSRQMELRLNQGNIYSESNGKSNIRWFMGPAEDSLVSWDRLSDDFQNFEVLIGRDQEMFLREGTFHNGKAILSQFVARKPLECMIYKYISNSEKTSLNSTILCNTSTSWDYCKFIDSVFEEMSNYNCEYDKQHPGLQPVNQDRYIQHASAILQMSCQQAARIGSCHYCWCSIGSCICNKIYMETNECISRKYQHWEKPSIQQFTLEPTSLPTSTCTRSFHFVIITHPGEFLRSTSSAKIAALIISYINSKHFEYSKNSVVTSEMIVYGCHSHMDRIDEILLLAETCQTCVLFPDDYVLNQDNVDSVVVNGRNKLSTKCVLHVSDEFNAATATEKGQMSCGDFADNWRKRYNNGPKTVVIVPDGSWEGARALLSVIRSKVTSRIIPCVSLDLKRVLKFQSLLIEALKSGQGLGRISTLEAISLFLEEVDLSELAKVLIDCQLPLIKYVETQITKPLSISSSDTVSVYKASSTFSTLQRSGKFAQVLDLFHSTAKLKHSNCAIPVGLRLCRVCGENLATADRMRHHVLGKKHCKRVLANYICSCFESNLKSMTISNSTDSITDINLIESLDEEDFEKIYQNFSVNVINNSVAEPPDFALEEFSHLVNCNRMSISNDTGFQSQLHRNIESQTGEHSLPKKGRQFDESYVRCSKGEKELQLISPPNVATKLPQCLRFETILSYNSAKYEICNAVLNLLKSVPSIGFYSDSDAQLRSLETFVASENVFRNFKSRQVLYQALKQDTDFLKVYDLFVTEICCPYLKQQLVKNKLVCYLDEIDFFYQYPPSLRLQPGPSDEHGPCHRDVEYGHQEGEVNFWLPLTRHELTQTTLWVESAPELGDFHPLAADKGEVALFHGSLNRHFAPSNLSHYTRVSLDFRIGIGKYFDPEWKLPTAKGQHGRVLHRL